MDHTQDSQMYWIPMSLQEDHSWFLVHIVAKIHRMVFVWSHEPWHIPSMRPSKIEMLFFFSYIYPV